MAKLTNEPLQHSRQWHQHAAHSIRLPTIYKEEECPSFIGYSTSNQCLPRARGAIQQDATWWLHPNGLEQTWVPQGQFHHLLYLGKLLSAAPYIIIPNRIQSLFFFLR
jgi:hypothetical protein